LALPYVFLCKNYIFDQIVDDKLLPMICHKRKYIGWQS